MTHASEKTIATISYIYICLLFAAELLLFASTLMMHLSTLWGADREVAPLGKILFDCNFAAAFPAVTLVKEKNVWRNEFKSCPMWLRVGAMIMVCYGLFTVCAQLIPFSAQTSLELSPLLTSAAFLCFDPLIICILVSLLWANPLSDAELIKRTKHSLIVSTLTAAAFVASCLGYLAR